MNNQMWHLFGTRPWSSLKLLHDLQKVLLPRSQTRPVDWWQQQKACLATNKKSTQSRPLKVVLNQSKQQKKQSEKTFVLRGNSFAQDWKRLPSFRSETIGAVTNCVQERLKLCDDRRTNLKKSQNKMGRNFWKKKYRQVRWFYIHRFRRKRKQRLKARRQDILNIFATHQTQVSIHNHRSDRRNSEQLRFWHARTQFCSNESSKQCSAFWQALTNTTGEAFFCCNLELSSKTTEPILPRQQLFQHPIDREHPQQPWIQVTSSKFPLHQRNQTKKKKTHIQILK